MATIEVNEQQKSELKSRGFVIKDAVDVVSNRRHFWDPRLDESGQVMGWTRPLPADPLRMNTYLARGFMLQDPQGRMAPPRGYFMRSTPPIASPHETKAVVVENVYERKCPICGKVFPDNDSLITHMIHHRSGEAKKKASKKPKRCKKVSKIRGESPKEVS